MKRDRAPGLDSFIQIHGKQAGRLAPTLKPETLDHQSICLLSLETSQDWQSVSKLISKKRRLVALSFPFTSNPFILFLHFSQLHAHIESVYTVKQLRVKEWETLAWKRKKNGTKFTNEKKSPAKKRCHGRLCGDIFGFDLKGRSLMTGEIDIIELITCHTVSFCLCFSCNTKKGAFKSWRLQHLSPFKEKGENISDKAGFWRLEV